jgi:NCAIR mutase (PurE)-related protein
MPPDFMLDFDRVRRLGFPEVVLASGKETAQIVAIVRQLARENDVLVTRLTRDGWEELSREAMPGHADYDERSRTLVVRVGKSNRPVSGDVAIVTAGTADVDVAEEARRTLEYLGVSSRVIADVGVAGVVRLLGKLDEIERADIVIAVAGMEGALFSVIGGLVGKPILCVPTSRGYGANFEGLASLLSALSSCANGVVAVNIDSGYAPRWRPIGFFERTEDMAKTKGKRRVGKSAEEYVHGAAAGVDRRKKKALLGRPTTPVRIGPETTVSQLLDQYRDISFQARALGRCAQVFEKALRDKDRPTIFLGLAGSLIAAGMRQVIVDLIENNMVDVVVSTGAIVSQDYYQVRGGRHYHGTPDIDDRMLRDLYIDRLYDTFIDEEKYWETDMAVSQFADRLTGKALSSRAFLRLLAETARHDEGSILGACGRRNVPLFVPALNDSTPVPA